jgi:hypothetical protein
MKTSVEEKYRIYCNLIEQDNLEEAELYNSCNPEITPLIERDIGEINGLGELLSELRGRLADNLFRE